MRRFLMLLMLPILAITLSSCASEPMVGQERADHTVYFDFGSAALTGDSRAKLDALAARLKADTSIDYVSVVGYADRIGSERANEVLSQKRAHNVKRYLEQNGYRAINVADTRWVGESHSTAECGDRANRAAINCLQQDRKVEVVFIYTYDDYCRNNTSRHCTQRPW